MTYQPNERVTWRANNTTKQGKVLAVIPPLTDPVQHVGFKNVKGYRIHFSAKLRDHVSYLCHLPATPGTRQPTLAWPRVKDIVGTEA